MGTSEQKLMQLIDREEQRADVTMFAQVLERRAATSELAGLFTHVFNYLL